MAARTLASRARAVASRVAAPLGVRSVPLSRPSDLGETPRRRLLLGTLIFTSVPGGVGATAGKWREIQEAAHGHASGAALGGAAGRAVADGHGKDARAVAMGGHGDSGAAGLGDSDARAVSKGGHGDDAARAVAKGGHGGGTDHGDDDGRAVAEGSHGGGPDDKKLVANVTTAAISNLLQQQRKQIDEDGTERSRRSMKLTLAWVFGEMVLVVAGAIMGVVWYAMKNFYAAVDFLKEHPEVAVEYISTSNEAKEIGLAIVSVLYACITETLDPRPRLQVLMDRIVAVVRSMIESPDERERTGATTTEATEGGGAAASGGTDGGTLSFGTAAVVLMFIVFIFRS
ncbi:hypothetical protein ACP4OV_012135 [Aristida adscensionis]